METFEADLEKVFSAAIHHKRMEDGAHSLLQGAGVHNRRTQGVVKLSSSSSPTRSLLFSQRS